MNRVLKVGVLTIEYPRFSDPRIAAMADEKTISKVAVCTTPDLSAGEVENQGFDHAATKKLLRKLDWHIIPFMSLIYLL